MDSIGLIERHLMYEQVRATVLDAVMRCGHTRLSVAEEAGVPPRRLAEFLRFGNVGPETARKLDVWCTRWGGMGAWPEQAALSLLVAPLPWRERMDAREAFVRWYTDRLERMGMPVPEWVADELEMQQFLRRGTTRPAEAASA
jgi:hypothetical protein